MWGSLNYFKCVCIHYFFKIWPLESRLEPPLQTSDSMQPSWINWCPALSFPVALWKLWLPRSLHVLACFCIPNERCFAEKTLDWLKDFVSSFICIVSFWKDSLMRCLWVTPHFQAIISNLIVGCLLTISKVTLCQRFSTGFRSSDWVGKVSILVLFWLFQWWAFWLDFFSREPLHIHVGLVVKQTKKCIHRWISSSPTSFSSSLHPAGVSLCQFTQLHGFIWFSAMDISHLGEFVHFLQLLRPNCKHRQCTFDELATTLHFSHHSCRCSDDFNLRLVKDMQWCVWSWRGSCYRTD